MLCSAFAGVVCVATLILGASLSVCLMQVLVLAAVHRAIMVSPKREEEAELDCSSRLSTSLDSSTAPYSTLSSHHWLLISFVLSFETKLSLISSGIESWNALVSCYLLLKDLVLLANEFSLLVL